MRQLRQLRELIGFHLEARDGEIGKLKQIYFDDQRWTVRYFVVHTGSWLSGQDVLIVPSVVTRVGIYAIWKSTRVPGCQGSTC